MDYLINHLILKTESFVKSLKKHNYHVKNKNQDYGLYS